MSDIYIWINNSNDATLMTGFYLGTILIILFSLLALYAVFLIVLSVLRSIFSKSLVEIILTIIFVATFFIDIILIATIGSYLEKAKGIYVFLIISSVLSYSADTFVNKENKK
ncbi:hypothetical protein LAD74_02145 [Mycoplasma sp. U97]|uniref:hypothetical protein n=1 Tax=Mycoplasma tauri TaxID=547987 RepID=UPI001CBDCF1E|nr:hypothetical protein [Mycoplasma tauri]MBZ4212780.1 hypothetical protein [Mycoplasma tauri]